MFSHITGKSEIKPESDVAISEIANLLKNNNALKLYVVDHTDNVGSFDFNMKLSKDRADAVVKTLSSQFNAKVAIDAIRGVKTVKEYGYEYYRSDKKTEKYQKFQR